MNITIRKFFPTWNEEKEIAFLEEMLVKGYKLISVGFGKYTFAPSKEVGGVYGIDYKGIKIKDIDGYFQLFEDAGWELVASYSNWYYFYQTGEDPSSLELFNDNKSKREKYKRLMWLMLLIGGPTLLNTLLRLPEFPEMLSSGEPFQIIFVVLLSTASVMFLSVFSRMVIKVRQLKRSITE